ncbi:hypothetical protein [Alkalihalobacterium alkalinitrilicum]|uniref:hypothetical protein n=1 Tax=Alkalihalobacterium alkalinitrilicum TaxID=427920 RepID=UPI00099498CC|nr:hypothetical protein [Alkalihalobacterium alkalinitrilicum]
MEFKIDHQNHSKFDIENAVTGALFQTIGYLEATTGNDFSTRTKEEVELANRLLGLIHKNLEPVLKKEEGVKLQREEMMSND